ncbi:unnamed protein product [Symbiodinium sp. CCMP2592]|nr:unnamed protein product [Symbiodinium sp. CCMP2592]
MEITQRLMSEIRAQKLPLLFRLPRKGLIAGSVLQHCIRVVDEYFKQLEPVVFKFGFTHNPIWRWTKALYGYCQDKDIWAQMVILHVSHEAFGPAMLEADLDAAMFGKEASCSSTIRAARNVVRDIGEKGARASGGLLELSRCKEDDAERDTHRLLVKRYRLSLEKEIPLSYLELKNKRLAILRLRDWMQFLIDSHCWHIVTGLVGRDEAREEAILNEFWSRYKVSHPSHPIFQLEAKGVYLGRCAPLIYHGDEGRGKRRTAFLVTSYSSILGRGSAPADKARKRNGVRKEYLKLRTNFRGHSFTNRFFQAGWPKAIYDNEENGAFELLLQNCKDENDFLMYQGLWDQGRHKKFHAVILAVTGDWPWLCKSGRLLRNFNHAVKKPKDAENPTGICHLCLAGRREHDFEHIHTERPSWLSTFLQEDPFDEPSVLATLPHEPGAAASIFRFDLWHSCHLGICKPLIGSTLALLSETYAGRSRDARFMLLSDDFLTWCRENKRQALLHKVTKETICWPKSTEFPSGSWFKGSLSTTFCEFIEATLSDKTFEDPLLTRSVEAVQALNKFLSGLYESDVFLDRHTATTLGHYGLRFLRRYSWCATEAVRQRRCLFNLLPKLHCVHHICLQDLIEPAQRHDYIINPLVYSVQLAEDYIGRNSRTSRRLHPATVTKRVAERHLQAAYRQYLKAGFLVEDAPAASSEQG